MLKQRIRASFCKRFDRFLDSFLLAEVRCPPTTFEVHRTHGLRGVCVTLSFQAHIQTFRNAASQFWWMLGEVQYPFSLYKTCRFYLTLSFVIKDHIFYSLISSVRCSFRDDVTCFALIIFMFILFFLNYTSCLYFCIVLHVTLIILSRHAFAACKTGSICKDFKH